MSKQNQYELVVYGGPPAGVACAVRAAREGLNVLVVTPTPHLGGMLASGLCVWDTQWEGTRAPIYDALRQAIFDHYRTTYGEDSPQYRASLPGPSGHSNGNFEPKVARALVEALVAREANITVVRSHVPCRLTKEGALLQSVTFRQLDGESELTATGTVFADCSYEGDLMALSGASYRWGREPRSEYGEPHAGRIFVRKSRTAPTPELERLGEAHDLLNLRKFPGYQEIVATAGSGAGDDRVQAYNWRTMLTDVPENRLPIERPPNYDPEPLRALEKPSATEQSVPNGKMRVNRPQLIGRQNPYVEGDWTARRAVMDEHWNALMASLYFLQTDPSVPEERRARYRELGLPADEFEENGHRPYEMYVRESRRLHGRYVFTEHDALLNWETGRAPIHPDAIGVTEWYIDVHACTDERLPGTLHEGKIMLHQETFPGQVPYRAILPRECDNLLVPLCVSSSHVGWSTIRLEPTWMNIGESAGWAAAIAVHSGRTPADIDPDALVRTLAQGQIMLTFFNDVDVSAMPGWIPAVEYFGTKGFFPGYDAQANETLTDGVARVWAAALAQLWADSSPAGRAQVSGSQGSGYDANDVARRVRTAPPGPAVAESEFRRMIAAPAASEDGPLRRGDACRIMFAAITSPGSHRT